MEKLFQQFIRRIGNTSTKFKRYLYDDINWNDRLIAIKGSRGVGKTTLILQYIKLNRPIDAQTLYVSLDDIYFQANKLVDLIEEFYINGGKYIYLDEVHKYDNWSTEIKNIYDNYPDLFIVFTSSSVLEINKGNADLSRRAVSYELKGLSFREYLQLEGNFVISPLKLEEILQNHQQIAQGIILEKRVLTYFKKYLEIGYYPFYREGEGSFYNKLNSVISLTIESDIPSVYKTEFRTINKIKRLLYLISTSLPYVPNITKLSEQLETTSRTSTLQYIEYLEKSNLISNLKTSAKGNNYLMKPDKTYLENTNLIKAIGSHQINEGTIRETFFNNQMGVKHQVNTSKESDFLINGIYTFEVGGKGKTTAQIKSVDNAFIAADNIEVGHGNKIPLWMFGLTY
jgi:predicted AAA+ superfamily ATPase